VVREPGGFAEVKMAAMPGWRKPARSFFSDWLNFSLGERVLC
jgi:hypothetical protein